jgi:hypothetical protein
MPKILVDGIKDVVFHNGIIRVECVSVGANGEQHPSGTLMIPGSMTGPVLQALANAVQELDKKIREHAAEQAAKAAETASETVTATKN